VLPGNGHADGHGAVFGIDDALAQLSLENWVDDFDKPVQGRVFFERHQQFGRDVGARRSAVGPLLGCGRRHAPAREECKQEPKGNKSAGARGTTGH
jgi:hypothetical protein